jgi:alanine-synthesizing transaminase
VFARIDRVLTRRAEAATKVVPINKPKSRPAAA